MKFDTRGLCTTQYAIGVKAIKLIFNKRTLMPPKKLPIDGTLDLHTFSPSDLGSLIPEYINECLQNKIYVIRIIHGRGTGSLRRSVHALLERNQHVISYSLANDQSGWGATIARISHK